MHDPSRLDHEKLHVYQLAVEFLRENRAAPTEPGSTR